MVPFSCLVGLVGLGVCPIRDEPLLAGEQPDRLGGADAVENVGIWLAKSVIAPLLDKIYGLTQSIAVMLGGKKSAMLETAIPSRSPICILAGVPPRMCPAFKS